MTVFAQNGDVRIAYEVVGEGGGKTPLALIHGLGYERHGFGPLREALAAERPLVLLDNRGIGESDAPEGPYAVSDLARDVLAVLNAAGIERADVLGTSLGGMVAQQLTLDAPDRVGRLVLASTTPGVRGVAMPERTVRLFAQAGTLPLEESLRLFVENSLADSTVRERPELVDEVLGYRLAHVPALDGWRAQAAAAMAFDALDRLGEIEAPTLVLHGTDDHVVDVGNASLLGEAIERARIERFDDRGHLLFWEEPDRFAASVLTFLGEP